VKKPKTKKESIKIAFGKAVRKLRLENKLSQEKLAELSDLHPNYISSVERGEKNISLHNIYKIARGLNSHPCALFHRLDNSFIITED
jgi:transcriptional regulator with XRE-family HTH domain